MRTAALLAIAFGSCFAIFGATPATTAPAHGWDEAAAAKYLDLRETWWAAWPTSQRDHGTVCISCHTVVPYALSRRAMRGALHEESPTALEQSILSGISKRVQLWSEVAPFYSDKDAGPRKTVESRGTEAIFNALVLANYDAEKGALSPIAKTAFDNMWALQLKDGPDTGSWIWLNFHNSPWEGNESAYMGATMAAIAVGIAPDHYAVGPAVQPSLQLLKAFLVKNYAEQPVVNRLILLLASARVPGLLTPEQKQSLEASVYALQKEDGGWSLPTFGEFKRHDNTPLSTKSDGYATGLAVFALEQAGVARSQPHVEKGLSWLEHNQDPKEGLWPSYSLNKERDPASDIGRFMSDAATAYAVMALKNSF